MENLEDPQPTSATTHKKMSKKSSPAAKKANQKGTVKIQEGENPQSTQKEQTEKQPKKKSPKKKAKKESKSEVEKPVLPPPTIPPIKRKKSPGYYEPEEVIENEKEITTQKLDRGSLDSSKSQDKKVRISDGATGENARRGSTTMYTSTLENATTPAISDDETFCKEFLECHNKYRKIHDVRPLKLNKKLVNFAKTRAKHIVENSFYADDLIQFGESVHIIKGKVKVSFTAAQIAKFWYDEISAYDFVAGKDMPNTRAFTQMVWKSTRFFGAAIQRYRNLTYIVAIYDPPGNVINKYKANVLPPLESTDGHTINNINLDFESQCLEEHNRYRMLHGCPALTLNQQLSEAATEWVHQLANFNKLKANEGIHYGCNMFKGESNFPLTGAQVVKIWYDEVKKYDFNAGKYSKQTGHFTQLIWRNTTNLGVGYKRIGNDTFVVCYYDPAGNYPDEFIENVPQIGSRPSMAEALRETFEEEELKQDIFNVTNEYRKLHGARPLKLNEEITRQAQEWAQHLAKSNALASNPKCEYGANFFLAQGVPKLSGERVVRAWYKEIAHYDFNEAKFVLEASHFTQLVWVLSKELGIGVAKNKGKNGIWVVCYFDPPGNWQGHFAENVLPHGTPVKNDPNEHVSFAQQVLNAHNKYRKLHGCPPLELSPRLCQFASEWATTLLRAQRLQRHPSHNFGENVAFGRGHSSLFNADRTVDFWYDEIKDFNFDDPKYSSETCHFTQVIWKNTVEMGADIVKNSFDTVVVAFYSPAGNVSGEFAANVPPKKVK